MVRLHFQISYIPFSGQRTLALKPVDWNADVPMRSLIGGAPLDFVRRGGDVMTGPLELSNAPSLAHHAATKEYVDTKSLPMPPVCTGNNSLHWNGTTWSCDANSSVERCGPGNRGVVMYSGINQVCCEVGAMMTYPNYMVSCY